MRNPAIILVKNEELTLDGIKQFYIAIDKEEWKFDTLVELYNNIEIHNVLFIVTLRKRQKTYQKNLRKRTSQFLTCMENNHKQTEIKL